ncbi:MAG TPA: hypothetical protein VGK67_17000 [Myxococcales bacterium]|jgi:hypothetical protein
MKTLQTPRGNALLITVVALAVLMVLVVGAIRFTGTNRLSAASKLNSDRVASCADVARRTLIAKAKLFDEGTKPSLLLINQKILDDVDAARQSTIITGHYDGTPKITAIPISAALMSGTKETARGLSNVLVASPTSGGQHYRVVMTCKEAAPSNRQAEIEFVFRYGY